MGECGGLTVLSVPIDPGHNSNQWDSYELVEGPLSNQPTSWLIGGGTKKNQISEAPV